MFLRPLASLHIKTRQKGQWCCCCSGGRLTSFQPYWQGHNDLALVIANYQETLVKQCWKQCHCMVLIRHLQLAFATEHCLSLILSLLRWHFISYEIHIQLCPKVYIPPDIFILNAIVNTWRKM